jgi:predicted DNA-binding transcriptional regulator YafY
MRADRLLSILILLQSRGMLTARDLARELEVSQRTIYRDMDALSAAGFPVYADLGKGGGYALLGDYELELSGFNTRDIQALSALNVPDTLDELGLGDGLRAALLKLLAALDADPQRDHDWMRQRFLMDSPHPKSSSKDQSNLPLIQQAVWEDRMILTRLRYPFQQVTSEPLQIAPYTLVTSNQRWYLIGARKDFIRVYPLPGLMDVVLLETSFTRPADYQPSEIWRAWQDTRRRHTGIYPVTLKIRRDLLTPIQQIRSWPIMTLESDLEQDDWALVQIDFDSLPQARMEILGMGSAALVIEPMALKLSINDYANEIIDKYKQ